MRSVDIVEAKTSLSRLLDEVAKGGDVVIMRHGKPVATLVPCSTEVGEEIVAKRRQALMEIREMARKRGIRISPEEIKAWIEEGRH